MVSVMIDLLLVLLLVLMAALGWRRGLIRSLAELAAVILALVLSVQLANVAAPSIINNSLRPATHRAIEEKVGEMDMDALAGSPREHLETALDGIPSQFVRQQAKALLDSLLQPAATAEETTKDKLVELGCQAADAVLDTAVYNMLHAALCAVGFALLLIVLRLAAKVLDLFAKLPVIRQANEIGGMLIGIVKGLLLVYVVALVICGLGLASDDTIAGTYLLRFLAGLSGLRTTAA